jgi:hypothetical protein
MWEPVGTGCYVLEASTVRPVGSKNKQSVATAVVTVRSAADAGRSGAMGEMGAPPVEYGLTVRPNPFTKATSIQYQIPVAGATSIRLYDVSGKLVRAIASGQTPAGYYSRVLDAAGLAHGVYVLKLESGDYVAARQLVIR